MKVAVFYSGLLEQLGQVFNQATFFNGKPAVQQPENYKSFNVGDADPTTPVGVDKITELAQQVAEFEPHMVILLGLQETIAEMKAVEAVWTNGTFRPRYFQPFPTGTAFWGPINPTTDEGLLERFTFINQFAPGGPGVEAKKRGIGPNLPFPNYANIGTPALIPAYDAVYVGYFLLAGQLATGQPVTNGASLAATMPFLQPASPPDDRKKIQAVKEQINEAITILGSGGKIDLEGAATSLNYTPTGGSPWVFELDCFRLVSGVLKDGTRGLKWDSIADKFSGTINPTCGDFPAQ